MAALSGRRVVVTGAGGFIGSHLAERLVEEGARVRAFVHYNALGSRGWLDESPLASQMEFVAGDITDPESTRVALKDAEIVFHLAALIAIPYSYVAPRSYLRTNVEGTLNVLEAARAGNIERLVHTSTSEVYGTARSVPIRENHPLQGQSPYSASKIGADKLAEAFHLAFGVPVVTVRPFNTFGPRQSARAVIPTIITQCLATGRVKLGNLHPTRDLNYVENTVDGFVKAASTQGAAGSTINLGSGREISIFDLATMIAKLTGRDCDIMSDAQRLRPQGSEVERLLADSTLANTILGWKPLIGLEEGLQRTVEWFAEHKGNYRANGYTT